MSGVRWLWRYGDPWRQLTEVRTEDTTVVTSSGTARLLRPEVGLQMRLPRHRERGMFGDGYFHRLARISVATPCGLVTWAGDSPYAWHAASPPLAVIAGADRDVHEAPMRRTVDRLLARFDGIIADGHPDLPCGALHCVQGVWPITEDPPEPDGPLAR